MLKSFVKGVVRFVAGGGLIATVVRSVGGGIAAGLGWKIASDLYDAAKRRHRAREGAPPPSAESADTPHAESR